VEKNETANCKMIIITKAVQFLVKRYKDKEIEMYCRDLWCESFEIMQEDARAGDPALKILKQVRDAPQKQEKQAEVVNEPDFSLKKIMEFGGMRD
jgi:hypothetical protein